MLTTPFRRCNQFRHMNGVVAISSSNFGHVVSSVGSVRSYAKDKGCCPEVAQAEGKKVEPWPKADAPPPAWRCECPRESQPPNYDPYRIKVPDVVVPPIPTSNAKWTGVVYTVEQQDKEGSPAAAQQAAEQPGTPRSAEPQVEEEEPKSEGFFATLKNLIGFGKSKKGGGDVSIVGKLEVPTEDGREPFRSPEQIIAANSTLQDLFLDSPIVHPDYWKDRVKRTLPVAEEGGVLPRLGYHGRSKYKYAFHEPWNPLDRVSLIAQAEKEEFEMSGADETVEKTEKVT